MRPLLRKETRSSHQKLVRLDHPTEVFLEAASREHIRFWSGFGLLLLSQSSPVFPPHISSRQSCLLQVSAGTSNKPTSTVTLYDTDLEKDGCVAAIGTGPVDAAYKAIDELVGTKGTRLLEYSVARYCKHAPRAMFVFHTRVVLVRNQLLGKVGLRFVKKNTPYMNERGLRGTKTHIKSGLAQKPRLGKNFSFL